MLFIIKFTSAKQKLVYITRCACGAHSAVSAVAFFRKKLRKNLLRRVQRSPLHYAIISLTPSPTLSIVCYPSHFQMILFACEKNHLVREKYGHKKACFLVPVFLSDLRRSLGFSSKNDATYRCPLEKSFCGAFFKKRPLAPAGAPSAQTKFIPLRKTEAPFNPE